MLLSISNLKVAYGAIVGLHGVPVDIHAGEIITEGTPEAAREGI